MSKLFFAFIFILITSTNLSFAITGRDSNRINKFIGKASNSWEAGNGNGATGRSYLIGSLDLDFRVAEVRKFAPSMDCKTEVFGSAKLIGSNEINLKNLPSYGENFETLQKMDQDGLVSFSVYHGWDGQSGDPEYCSDWNIEVYFKNGKFLDYNFNSTD